MSLQSPVEAITILRQFPFSSSLQRMSVVVQLAGEGHFHVYMKGAPEMVVRFCKSETGSDTFLFQEVKYFKRPNKKQPLHYHHHNNTKRTHKSKNVEQATWGWVERGPKGSETEAIISRHRDRE
jgi:magnesium-transporting ATPase (P-type)